jgi:hypothetical protein
MATVKKYQKGGVVSTVKKAAAKAIETVKKSAPKSNPFKNAADLSKTPGQRFLSKDKVEMKDGGKMKKAQYGMSMGKQSLREGQVKRIERIDKSNPERAVKVAKRMLKRAPAMKKGGKMKKAC